MRAFVCAGKTRNFFAGKKGRFCALLYKRPMFLLSQALIARKKRIHMDLILILLAMIVFGIGILMIPKAPKKKEKHYILIEVEVEDKK